MGRRKISIAPIKDDRNRQVTFLKRKNGLFKKAYELGVLCSADVAVIVFNTNGKLFEFHSGDMDSILLRYSHYSGPAHEKRGPEDYINKDLDAAIKSGTGGKMTTLSDEDGSDEDDDKPHVATGSSGVRAIPQTSKGKQALRAQAERKAKGLEPARSQSIEAGSDSRASSFSGPSAQLLQQQQQDQRDGNMPQLPSDPSVQNGFVPPGAPGSLPFSLAGLPGLNGPGGLPNLTGQLGTLGFNPFNPGGGLPSFPGFPGGLPPNFPFPMPAAFGFQPQQQPNGAGGAGSNAVPAWFGALNPAAVAQGQGQMPQAQHLQLLQQLASLPALQGWPGVSLPDPAAALQAFQQQQQHDAANGQQHPQFASPFAQHLMQQQQHQQQQQQHQQQQQQQQAGSPHPTPAPMYGTPAAMPPPPPAQHGTPPVYPLAAPATGAAPDEHGHGHGSRPGSVASMRSHAHSQHSPATRHAHAHASPPTGADSWQNKPRLSVAIPAESGVKEGTKPGLVTAGGASMLGAGLAHGGSAAQEPQVYGEEHAAGAGGAQPGARPKSAFAADLLPSPFYPNASTSSPYAFMPFGTSASSSTGGAAPHFHWPAAPPPTGPAPALDAADVPDLLRRGSFADLTSAAAAAAQAGEEDVVRGLKRGSGEDGADAEDGQGRAGGRKRRG